MNNLTVIEKEGQRVLTTQQLAEVYGVDEKKIRDNFTNNKERYIEGKHYFKVEGEELRELKNDTEIFGAVGARASSVYLWTERGTLRHAKSLGTDKAWEIYERLEETYFRTKELDPYLGMSKELKAILFIDKKTQELEDRVEGLENTMTIDYGEQLFLKDLAGSRAIKAMGGKDSAAYKDKGLRGKVYSTVWKDYKDYFDVNSYRNTAKKDYERAKEYLRNWQAQGKILREIEDCNNQIKIEREAM